MKLKAFYTVMEEKSLDIDVSDDLTDEELDSKIIEALAVIHPPASYSKELSQDVLSGMWTDENERIIQYMFTVSEENPS